MRYPPLKSDPGTAPAKALVDALAPRRATAKSEDPRQPLPSPDGLKHLEVLVAGVHTYRLAGAADDADRPRWVLFWTTPERKIESQEFPSPEAARQFARGARCSRAWDLVG